MAYLKSLGCLLHTKVLTLDYRRVTDFYIDLGIHTTALL